VIIRETPACDAFRRYGDDERRRRAGKLGGIEFVTKPVDFDRSKEQLRQLPVAAV
jgi:hypothetical protein